MAYAKFDPSRRSPHLVRWREWQRGQTVDRSRSFGGPGCGCRARQKPNARCPEYRRAGQWLEVAETIEEYTAHRQPPPPDLAWTSGHGNTASAKLRLPEQPVPTEVNATTFAQEAEMWMAQRQVSKKQVLNERRWVEAFLNPAFGDEYVHLLRPQHLDRLLADPKVATLTRARLGIYSTACLIVDFCLKNGRLDPPVNQLRLATRPKYKSKPKNPFTPDDFDALVRALPEPWDLWARVVALTGLRLGESLALSAGQIVAFDQAMVVNRSADDDGNIKEDKTGVGWAVPIPDEVFYDLMAYITREGLEGDDILFHYLPQRRHGSSRDLPYGVYRAHGKYQAMVGRKYLKLWDTVEEAAAAVDAYRRTQPDVRGPAFDPRTPVRQDHLRNRLWEPAKERAGLGGKPYTPYDLRHTCASWLLAKGMGVYDIMRWMRHSDVKTTQNYIQDFPGYVRELARRYAEATTTDPNALLRATQGPTGGAL